MKNACGLLRKWQKTSPGESTFLGAMNVRSLRLNECSDQDHPGQTLTKRRSPRFNTGLCVTANLLTDAVVTQLGECKTEDLEVAGSSPAHGTSISHLISSLRSSRCTHFCAWDSLNWLDALRADRRGFASCPSSRSNSFP